MNGCEKVVYNLLSTNSDVVNLVEDRIYPDVVPMNKPLPAIVYAQTEGMVRPTVGGFETSELLSAEITVIAIARSAAVRNQLAEVIRRACDRHVGKLAGFIATTCRFKDAKEDMYDEDLETFSRPLCFLVTIVKSRT